MPAKVYTLGTIDASEQLIQDLYIGLRQKVQKWAAVTQQTPQARMGYVGQHLASIVTGFPGGRSGARGKDLILPGGEYAEIKTCYRVDQLGACNKCGAAVASIEATCASCGSTDLKRNDDSKWLIGIRNAEEFKLILTPKYYFFVLFEFLDFSSTDRTIQASIWRVDPKAPGFAFCMIDYYFNIQSKSKSGAPFNLWPYQLKFDIMRPLLVYRSLIKTDDTIQTVIFPGTNDAERHMIKSLKSYSRSLNLTTDKVKSLAASLGLKRITGKSKDEILEEIQTHVNKRRISPDDLSDALAFALYMPEIKRHLPKAPEQVKKLLPRR